MFTVDLSKSTDVCYLDERFEADNGFSLMKHCLLLTYRGSTAYNLRTPESDTDIFGIVIPPPERLLGLRYWESWEPDKKTLPNNLDVAVYSLNKFASLAVEGNPNVVETLFVRPEFWIAYNDLWTNTDPLAPGLYDLREKFLSKNVYKRFSGYATGQMKKMTAGQTQNYMGRERRELVQQIGYDPKDASRLLHLLFMGGLIAAEGLVKPHCEEGPVREALLAVKRGEWTLEDVKAQAELLARTNEYFYTRIPCPLPDEPDRERIDQLLVSLHLTNLGCFDD